ncbi:hypothetical protein [Blastococcus mobilis]|uniref:Uncharacterized protein n=1 Tax=Blastococcus mobilis TaxID=1938746 RepID=A0A238VX78_9ACTN|nr:hypothetical protein [Blastococcus mobilis]SNR38744.1 hypothetical protein SAMN06272737_105118 [Blastococcus mobilis]
MPTEVTTELGPVERALGIAYLSDVDLEDGPLPAGAAVVLVDEGGHRHPGVVAAVEPGHYGRHYRVRFTV